MKLTITETHAPGQPELILRCGEMTPALHRLAQQLQTLAVETAPRITARAEDGATLLLAPADIYYLESVDELTFAYTRSLACRVPLTLAAAVQTLAAEGFVRAGKAQVVNVKHLVRLESRIGGGLDGTLDNGEHILISRRCAKELRECLKGGLFL